MLTLLVDDLRELKADIIARTGEAGLIICASLSINSLLIDHDLGYGMNGYQLINKLIEEGLCPPNVEIVSANPVGVENIGRALIASGYTPSLDGRTFTKD